MSLHRPDSELSRLNASNAISPRPAAPDAPTAIRVSPDLFNVLSHAQEIAAQTAGSFDITIRPLADLWGFIWKEYRLPTEAELKEVLPRVNHRFLELHSADRTVRFTRPGVSLDLGGIAKGYAVDCATAKLHALGITNAMIKAGGDLRVIGAPPGQTHWIVQLEDPGKQGRRFPVRLRDAALSTSGNYENFFEINARRYAHILDPRTGLPVPDIAACTVIAPTCMESDAWATALVVLGVEQSLSKFGGRLPIRFTLMPDISAPHQWPVRISARWLEDNAPR